MASLLSCDRVSFELMAYHFANALDGLLTMKANPMELHPVSMKATWRLL